MTIQEIENEFGPKFEAITQKAAEIGESLEEARNSDADDASEKVQEFSKALTEIDGRVKELTEARDAKLREAEIDGMKASIETLSQALEGAMDPVKEFSLGGSASEQAKSVYGEKSFYADARRVMGDNDSQARERWEEALGSKAMVEHDNASGGFLVPEQVSSELLELREQATVLRSLFSRVSVTSDQFQIAAVSSGLTAGWVAELAEKPLDDLKFGQVSTNIFTKAGLAVVSNQLLKDANRSVDTLINRDLARRLAALEEIALLAGDGNGKPLGILNTPGVQHEQLDDTGIPALLDKIVDAITNIYTNYFGAPNAIILHPRTWGRIVKAREATAPTTYLVGSGGSAWGRRANDPLPGYGQGPVPRGDLFGLPVYTTANVPTTLGAANNESCVIVGNFSEGLILDREGITLDNSKHVYFTSNQTIFRAEDRVGFTAARYPKAFNVVQGEGLADG